MKTNNLHTLLRNHNIPAEKSGYDGTFFYISKGERFFHGVLKHLMNVNCNPRYKNGWECDCDPWWRI